MNEVKICAGIVTYNPNIKRLLENINAIYNQVELVIIFDNGSRNVDEIDKIIKLNSLNCVLIKSSENKGIAYALNSISSYAYSHNYHWLLTLDQDSVSFPNIISVYKKYLYLPNIGQLSCDNIDRNEPDVNINEDYKVHKIKWCITSGSLVNLDALVKVGGFDSFLFIDRVDFEICSAFRKYNYNTYKIDFVGILHELGQISHLKVGNKEIILYNHSAFRRYYMARNGVILSKYYPKEYSLRWATSRQLKLIGNIILGEKDKVAKIKAILKGLIDGYMCNEKRKFYNI